MLSENTQLLDSHLFSELLDRARQSPRLRTNHNFHHALDENAHRFLNVMIRGTYIAPHRHIDPPKPETFLILAGEVGFFTFNDRGQVTLATRLGHDPVGIDIEPGVWHSMAVLSEYAVCFEVKPGPYSATNDKEFAPWAPREADEGAQAYLGALVSSF